MSIRKIYEKMIRQVEKEEGKFRGVPPKLKLVDRPPKLPAYVSKAKYFVSKKTGKRRLAEGKILMSRTQTKKLKKHPDILKDILLHELRETRAMEEGAKTEYQSHRKALKKEKKGTRKKYESLRRKRIL